MESQHKCIPPSTYDRPQQPEQETANLASSHHHTEVDEVIPSQASFSDGAAANGRSERATIDLENNGLSPPTDLEHTKVFQPDHLIPICGFYGLPDQADTQFNAALSLEATFNRNSIPLCQRPYGAPMFMRVIHGDMSGVYSIIVRAEGSLWDHDPYELGLLYLTIAEELMGKSVQWLCTVKYLLRLEGSDDNLVWRTDEIGNALTAEELTNMIDMPDARGRSPLAWAVEYGLTTSTELLLSFGADPNQLRLTKDGGFSPLIYLAVAGSRPVWMDAEIVETVRLLLQVGADPNGADHEGWTPLHIAASWSLFNVTNMLQRGGRHFLNWQARTFTGESILDVCDNKDYRNRYWGMLEGPAPSI